MAAYLIATVRITDPERFGAYVRALSGLGERYGGESMVRATTVEVLEGAEPPGERIVVSKFADVEAVRRYIGSEDYQKAKALRAGAAEVVMRIAED